MTKYLVLNELHPDEQPGAASIAFDYAVELAKKYQTQFVSCSRSSPTSKCENLEVIEVERKVTRTLNGYLGEIYKSAVDLLSLSRALMYFRLIKEKKPDVIWVHQIGNFIPRLILAFLPFIAPVVMTAHDYGLIVPRKLYPKDLKRDFLSNLGVKYEKPNSNLKASAMLWIKELFYASRRFLLKCYVNRVKLVCISEQQANVFRYFGFKVAAVIPNGISLCQCNTLQLPNREKHVLFLGRLNGKGLSRLLASARDSRTKLCLAGSEELDREIKSFSGEIDAKFLGKLNRPEVFREIHKSTFVYLASECFDVYPTTGLEAIRHGAIPIVSDTTGLRELVHEISPALVLDSATELVPFEKLFQMIESCNSPILEQLVKANEDVLTVGQSLERYLKEIRTY